MQTYTSILILDFLHDYYVDGKCRDLVVTPSPETVQLIQGHRLQVKYAPDGVEVFAPLTEGSDLLIPLLADTSFRWWLQPKAPLFEAITQLPAIRPKVPYQYSNRISSIAYPPDLLTPPPLSSGFFDEFGGLLAGVNELYGSLGLAYTETEVELDSTTFPQRIPLDQGRHKAALPKGVSIDDFHFGVAPDQWNLLPGRMLEFAHTPIAENGPTTIAYPTKVATDRNVMAVVDIWLDTEIQQAPATPLVYTLAWKPSQHHWHYLLVGDRNFVLNSGTARVLQSLGSSPPVPLPCTFLDLRSGDLNTFLPAGDPIAPLIKLTWEKLQSALASDEQAFLLRTQSSWAYAETCRIQLQRKKGSGFENPGDNVAEAEADEFYFLPPPDPLQHGFSVIQYPSTH